MGRSRTDGCIWMARHRQSNVATNADLSEIGKLKVEQRAKSSLFSEIYRPSNARIG